MQTEAKTTKAKRIDYIQESYFLKALRDGGTFSKDYERLYGNPDTLPEMNREDVFTRVLATRFLEQPVEPASGGEIVSGLLRYYTDEWLATGIGPAGVEQPFARKLTATKHALAAVKQHNFGEFALRIDWDNGLERCLKPVAERLTIHPRAPLSPAKAVSPAKAASLTGRSQVISAMAAHWRKKRDGAALKAGCPYLPKKITQAASIRAVAIFHAFMEAPWRYKLGKCKRCSSYFTLKINPREIYKRGMHCPECKSNASAVASNNAKRTDREKRLIGLAADVWSSWRPAAEFDERNGWVAKQVNKSLDKHERIHRNWVTRHEEQIATEAKRRNHAKS